MNSIAMRLHPKVGKFRNLSKTLARIGAVVSPVYVIIILNGRTRGAEAFDFGPAKKIGLHFVAGETESISGPVNKFTLTLKFWSYGSTY
jgi:hypothetical protein